MAVDATFERHLQKPEPLCVSCAFSKREEPNAAADFERFEGIVRAYRRRRLELPVRAIWDESFGHGSALVHASVRRLAWFVPSILAASLAEGFAEALRRLAGWSLEAMEGERTHHASAPRDLLPSERQALDGFWVAAVRAISPHDSDCMDDWAAVFLASMACGGDTKALVRAWAMRPDVQGHPLPTLSRLAALDASWQRIDRDELARGTPAWSCPTALTALRVFHGQIFTEDTRQLLEALFLSAPDSEAAALLSAAEQAVAGRLGLRRG